MSYRVRSSSVSLQRYLALSTAIFASVAVAADAVAAFVGDPVRDARCFAKCYRQIAAEQPKVRTHTHPRTRALEPGSQLRRLSWAFYRIPVSRCNSGVSFTTNQ